MANRNISATVQIGASMSSSVGSVFGRIGKQIDALGSSLAKVKRQSADITRLQAAQGKLAEAKTKGNAAAVKRYSDQIEKLSASLREAGVDTSNLTSEQARLASAIARSEHQLTRFTRLGASVTRLRDSARGLGETFGTLRERLGGAFIRLGVGVGILGAAAGAATYLTTEFVDQGDALADQAEALNMATNALQTWQFAAGTVGIESEKLGAIFSKLQSKISEGSDDTKESFAKLGVKLSMLRKMKPEEQLTHITEAFSRLPDKVNKTALANDIFGKSGYKLLPVLKGGAEGLRDIYDEAKRTGYILSNETNDAVNKADAAWNTFKLQLQGFRNRALAPLLPTFTMLTTKLGEVVEKHGPQFTAWIETAGVKFMESLAPRIEAFVKNDLPGLIDGLGKVVGSLTKMASWLADVTGGWDNLSVGLVALNFAPVIASVFSLGRSLWGLAAASFAVLGPWGLLAVAAIGATVAVVAFRKEIRAWMDSAPGWMKTIGHFLLGPIGNLIVYWDKASIAVNAFKNAIGSAIDSAVAKIEALMAKMRELATLNVGGFKVGDIGGAMLDVNPFTAPARLGKRVMESLMPADAMPAAGGGGSVQNNVEVKIDARGSDPAAIESRLRSSLKSTPLYDTTGVLAPQ